MTQIRVGILSFAHLHAESYVHNLRANPLVDLVGFADDDVQRGEMFSNKYRVPYFDSFEALFDQHLDAVIVCSENSRHLEMVSETPSHQRERRRGYRSDVSLVGRQLNDGFSDAFQRTFARSEAVSRRGWAGAHLRLQQHQSGRMPQAPSSVVR
jgi:hypothetical protein